MQPDGLGSPLERLKRLLAAHRQGETIDVRDFYRLGAEMERQTIVAWLRISEETCVTLDDLADLIEAREHFDPSLPEDDDNGG